MNNITKMALALGVAAVASADTFGAVTSQIAGYRYRDLTRGELNYCVANFLPTGKAKEELTLGDLCFNANFKVSTIQILQDGGETMELDWEEYPLLTPDGEPLLAIFRYVPAASAGEGGAGWYLQQDTDCFYNMNDWETPFGWQYVVDCGDAKCKVANSGLVDEENEEFDLERGALNYLGNCTPSLMTMGDLVLGPTFKVSTIQIFQDGGETMELDWEEYPLLTPDGEPLLAIFRYVPAASAGAGGAGWYLQQDTGCSYNMNEWEIESADGFAVDCGDAKCTIIVPSALPQDAE